MSVMSVANGEAGAVMCGVLELIDEGGCVIAHGDVALARSVHDQVVLAKAILTRLAPLSVKLTGG